MSNAKRCDRCGEFYQPMCHGAIVVYIDHHPYGSKMMDLCKQCEKELGKWLQLKFKNNCYILDNN